MARELAAFREKSRCVMSSEWMNRGYFRESVVMRLPLADAESATTDALIMVS
jgi:hypothetical protein